MKKPLSDEEYIKRMFKSYYVKAEINPPKDFSKREYAFTLTAKGEMIRHKSFDKWADVKDFLIRNAPLHVYYSSAYYLRPDAPDMDAKEWIGADLIFDIDVDHIYTECKEEHDKWSCLNCGFSARGVAPDSCPQCSSKRIDSKVWFCEKCLGIAKEETIKLVEDFLISDFGLSPSEIEIVFSGRRGFHIHVESDVVKELDQRARREIVDYVKGIGLQLQSKGKKTLYAPQLNAPGWHGRIARGVYEFLSSHEISEIAQAINFKNVTKLKEAVDYILSMLEKAKDEWPLKGDARKVWLKAIERVIALKRCEVDERVTTDIKRLIRLPGSLHGKTGLIVLKLKLSDFETFDPFDHAVAFRKGEIKVRVHDMPKITFLNSEWGPYEEQVVEMPVGLAIYLLCSGNACLAHGDEKEC